MPVLAPMRSRPRQPLPRVREGIEVAATFAGSQPIAWTEMVPDYARALRHTLPGWTHLGTDTPGRRRRTRARCPVSLPPGWAIAEDAWGTPRTGVDLGCRAIPGVAPTRRTVWVVAQPPTGPAVGIIATHMHPGGWVKRLPAWRARLRPLVQRLWRRHARRVTLRVGLLGQHCPGGVWVLADVNRPGPDNYFATVRVGPPGLAYLGYAPATTHRTTRLGWESTPIPGSDHRAIRSPRGRRG